MQANSSMTFYGQEKVEYNAQLCLMNMAVHGLTGVIKSGDEANSFYHDAHNFEGCCNYVMANPPFNVDKVKAESAANAGRLPFGIPKENKNKEIGNANYLWISYFYAYLNETGRAGFVMASSATDSQGGDKDIRERLVKTDKLRNKVLFIDARNYYTVVDRTLNEWSEWQLKNMNAIVWLYRSETDKYNALLEEYKSVLDKMISEAGEDALDVVMDDVFTGGIDIVREHLEMLRESAKNAVEACDKKEKKKLQAAWDERIAFVEEIADVVKEANWLYCKFGEGRYEDIPGLCKIANVEAIEGKGWSLTPGAYVGVAPEEDDGVDFRERMVEIHKELLELQAESNELMNTISENMKEMGLWDEMVQ